MIQGQRIENVGLTAKCIIIEHQKSIQRAEHKATMLRCRRAEYKQIDEKELIKRLENIAHAQQNSNALYLVNDLVPIDYAVPPPIQCPTCENKFIQDKPWKKTCTQCYFKRKNNL